MRILLTGAAGFIGSHVHDALTAAGHDVVAVDAMLPQAHGPGAAPPPDIHRCDVRDVDGLTSLLRGVDAVCHQAALVGIGVDMQDAPGFAAHNDLGTAAMSAAMHRAGCARLVLASSMVVYGDGAYVDRLGRPAAPRERSGSDLAAGRFERYLSSGEPARWSPTGEDAPLAPQSLYAASKAAQEHYCAAWARATGGHVVALRYHNVYGPRMPRDTPYAGVASIFRSALAAGCAPRVFEDGGQTRDFVHVSDVANANVLAIESLTDGGGFVPLNVCSGTPVTVGDVARILAEHAGGPAPVVTGEYRAADVRHIVADPARARELLGFTARIAPDDGLARFATDSLRATTPNEPQRV
ncbi:NAD-dependent epimerase/dehydratase family protein [Tsukamurella sp. 8F]|uniref:NAD-dependent epimerase/dehydratase family protein n=1 Tax=unclassified Tsukamurella TaxID=2633480 RepID=UPI0023B9B054|nr:MULTISPECIES: NAD-dependent epimerase/dehydratase family protein [unclassified Tsukamurella]MDF0529842.1 NAD-dependent epimerase/dehydratase family protein [Tsukamurella sp. 8J]MDF0587034.1 NAD-dependent epimerase/dehydratase family protein [Tsukamurella sp. 8F]